MQYGPLSMVPKCRKRRSIRPCIPARKFLPQKFQDYLGQFNPSYSKFKIGARLSSRLGPSLSFIETRIISVIFSFTKFIFFYSRDLIGQQTFKAKNILPSEEEKILKLLFFFSIVATFNNNFFCINNRVLIFSFILLFVIDPSFFFFFIHYYYIIFCWCII